MSTLAEECRGPTYSGPCFTDAYVAEAMVTSSIPGVQRRGERSAQSYVHECGGDGAYISVTLSDGPPGHIYPATINLGPCVLCDADPVVMRATTPEYLAELDAMADEEPERIDAAEFSRRSLVRRGEGFVNPASPDTSEPYFLDLIARIDDATR